MSDGDFLRSIFLMEAWDTVSTVEEGLPALADADGAGVRAALEPLLVVTHRLRGAAALQGFAQLGELAAMMEVALESAPDTPPAGRRPALARVRELLACAQRSLDAIAAGAGDSAAATAAPREAPDAETAELLGYFAIEAAEHLEAMTRSLLALESNGADAEELGRLFRAVHTLKGAAYTVRCTAVGDLAHRLEDLLVAVREGGRLLTADIVEVGFAAVDAVRLLLPAGREGSDEVADAVRRVMEGIAAATGPPPAVGEPEDAAAPPAPSGEAEVPP
ncbi:MAG: Hpt domain-containing protein, partial [Candidatus Rokuibacteriota bacterium]